MPKKQIMIFILSAVLLLIFWFVSRLVSVEVIQNEYLAETNDYLDNHFWLTEEKLFEPIDNDFEIDTEVEHSEAEVAPLVAIIIDDFGPKWRGSVVDGFLDLPYDITISIISGNLTSVSVAQKAEARGKEVFLHLPMEPEDANSMEERDMLYVTDDSSRVAEVISRAIRELPNAVGVNNHMGSKGTKSEELMHLIATEIKQRKLFFVDSRTVPKSVALGVMQEFQIPALGRDVFLDYESDSNTIAEQLDQLVRIAHKRGWAIGIGHVKSNTLRVMQRDLPKYEREGVRFISAGQLIREKSKQSYVVNLTEKVD